MDNKPMELYTMKEYTDWIKDIKKRISTSQMRASVRVNQELLSLYWFLGGEIIEKQEKAKWGDKLLQQMSKDLQKDFPNVKGFSKRNLELVRKWYLYYCNYVQENVIAKQPVSQLENIIIFNIPWGHNLKLISKCKSIEESIFYAKNVLEYGWSRTVLEHQIESGLYERQGSALTNFTKTLPEQQSDLAQQVLKDPYKFDFLEMTADYDEKELEDALVDHITQFLLELGTGFAYVGRQYELKVGESFFYLDLLFYHIKLHCYVVIELKTVKFEPSFAGQLKFYVTAVNKQLKSETENPTIGIIICKSKDEVVAEYALEDIEQPIGITEYELSKVLNQEIKSNLPSIEEIESEMKNFEV